MCIVVLQIQWRMSAQVTITLWWEWVQMSCGGLIWIIRIRRMVGGHTFNFTNSETEEMTEVITLFGWHCGPSALNYYGCYFDSNYEAINWCPVISTKGHCFMIWLQIDDWWIFDQVRIVGSIQDPDDSWDLNSVISFFIICRHIYLYFGLVYGCELNWLFFRYRITEICWWFSVRCVPRPNRSPSHRQHEFRGEFLFVTQLKESANTWQAEGQKLFAISWPAMYLLSLTCK